MKEFAFICRAVLILLLLVLQLPAMSVGAAGTVTVTTLGDATGACAGSGAGACSLRDAVTYANAHSGTTVTFQGGLTGTITLTGGALPLNASMTITGPGAKLLAVDGNNADRVFAINTLVSSGVSVTMSGLTIQHGTAGASSSGGGIAITGADLNLSDCAIVANTSGLGSGGVSISVVSGHPSNVTIARTTFSGNTSGAIFTQGTLTLTNSTISGNSATGGGFGGGLRVPSGTVTITNSTISNNAASNGGGISAAGGSVTIQNTIVSGNTLNGSNADVNGTVTSLGYNLIGNISRGSGFISSDFQNVNPLLGALQDNGGQTATQALGPTSPALDAVPAVGGGCPAVDQRGIPRAQGVTCDIGAYELATTVYVDGGAAVGGNGMQAASLQSLTNAISNVTAGGTVFVAANTAAAPTYNAHVTVDRNVTIVGAGASTTIVDGTNSGTVFTIPVGVTASMSGLTIQHGKNDGGIGGGIANKGTLTLTDSVLANNTAGDGGGLYTESTLTIVNSTVSGNASTSSGGGIFIATGTVDIQRSTISGNTQSARGAGIFNDGVLTITNSTISGNTTALGFGAGIDNDSAGTLNLTASTVTLNSAGDGLGGGGLVNNGTVNLLDSIIAGNSAPQAPDVSGTITSQGHNLIGNTSESSGFGASDLRNVAPLLGPLTVNAPGTTATHALRQTSPAIDAGGTCPAGVTTDQRGTGRVQGSACDIGAYEYVPVTPTVASLSPTTLTAAGGAVTITGTGFQTGTTVTLAGGTPTVPTTVAADGASLTVTLPVHAAGSVPLQVTNPGNLSTAGTISYTPVIASLNPGSGVASGGGTVTISGAGYVAGSTSVTFGTTPMTIAGVTPTQISVTVPAHAAGAVDVTVTVNGQSVTKAGAYTYGTVNALPPSAPAGGGSGNPPSPLPGTRSVGTAPSGAPPQALPSSR